MKPEKLGRYTLIEKLTTGGMAEVYRAVAKGPDGFRRIVAIKKILPCYTDSADFRKMFVDEATIAARLNHANIAQVYDFEIVGGVPYIAMEFVEGKDLRAILQRATEMGIEIPYPLATYVAMEVSKGLYYVHSRRENSRPLNIVHRDVSPQNIMLSHTGSVKLVDFGIARAVDRQSSTQAGVVKGKYAYMSPEQALGKMLDHRSDIFSLGVVLWEMLTLQRLFAAGSEPETIANVLKGRIPLAHEVNPAVPERLSLLVSKALQRERDRRTPSMLAMYESLTEFLMTSGTYPDMERVSRFLTELFPGDMERLWQGEHLALEMTAEQDLEEEDFEGEDDTPEVAGAQTVTQGMGEGPTIAEEETAPTFRMEENSDRPLDPRPGSVRSRWMLGLTLVLLLAFVALSSYRLLVKNTTNSPEVSAGDASSSVDSEVTGEESDVTSQEVDALDTTTEERFPQERVGEPVPTSPEVVEGLQTDRPEEGEELGEDFGLEPGGTGEEGGIEEPPRPHQALSEPMEAREADLPAVDDGKVHMEFLLEPADAVLRINQEKVIGPDVTLDVQEGALVKVEVYRGGYHPFKGEIEAHNGEVRKIVLGRSAQLLLYIEPRNAVVRIDGKKAEKGTRGEWAYSGAAGSRVLIEVEKRGFATHSETLELVEGEQRHRVRLNRGSSAKPTPASAAELHGEGHIRVQARPWADVVFRGEPKGRTPVLLSVETGSYEVELVHLTQKHTCRVKVEPGKTSACKYDFEEAP